MSRRPKSYWPWSTGTQTLVEPKTRAIVSLIGVAARTMAGAQMPNALPVPAMPASLRKERRWSAISSLLWSCSRANEHANRVPALRSVRTIFVNDGLQRREAEAVAGIVDLRAVRERGNHVHLGAEVDVIAGLAFRHLDRPAAVAADRTVHEHVHVERDILPGDAPGLERSGEIVAAVLAVLHAVGPLVCEAAAGAGQYVVNAAAVRDDRHHGACFVGIEDV